MLGMLPFARRADMDALSVNALIQAAAAVRLPPIGAARSEPPRKPGIGCPFTWLGITNCATLLL